MKSDQAVTDRAVAQYRGARNQKPGGRSLCGGMVQLHPAHIMAGVVLHTLCEDGHSRRPVASPLLKLRLTTVFYICERHRKDLHLLTHS
eukprot:COSAG06_NODE_35_length_30757_cov_53.112532_3_plen_89_part_00